MTQEKDFLPYDESYEVKELGFNEPCIAYHNKPNDKSLCFVDLFGFIKEKWIEDYHVNSLEKKVSAPTFSQAFRFFREKYNLSSTIIYRVNIDDGGVCYDWLILGQDVKYRHFDTYEDAEISCLRKLIEIVKNTHT